MRTAHSTSAPRHSSAAPPSGSPHPYLRLDTLEAVTPSDPLLWGSPVAARVRRSALFHEPAPGRVPFMRISPLWAVRLVSPSTPTEALAAARATVAGRQLAELAEEVLGGGPLSTREAAAVALSSALLFGRMRRYQEAVEVLELVTPALCAALGVSLP